MTSRIETGKLQIGDDWPGVFIRGDSALMGCAPALRALLSGNECVLQRALCDGPLNLLESANAHNETEAQKIVLAQVDSEKGS